MSFIKGHKINNGRKQTSEHIHNAHISVINKRTEIKCKGCSSIFMVSLSHTNKVFCKKQCYSTWMKGMKPWNKGLKGYKAGVNHHWYGRNMSGNKNPKYKKDRTTLVKKQERNDSAYAEWRKRVWVRDNFKCKMKNKDCVGKIECHHILPWRDYPELRYEVNNGITLCHAHHPRKRKDEAELSPYFQKLLTI